MSDVMPSDHGDALDFLQRIAQTTSSRGVTLSWNGLRVGAARPGFTSPQLATAVRTPALQFGTGDIAVLKFSAQKDGYTETPVFADVFDSRWRFAE